MGLVTGASLAFFMASSNFFVRMSSLLDSWNQESRNLSSRWRFCSARMPAASVRSTPGPALGGASWERTTPRVASMVSLAWQHGHATCRAPSDFFAMGNILRFFFGEERGCRRPVRFGGKMRETPARRLSRCTIQNQEPACGPLQWKNRPAEKYSELTARHIEPELLSVPMSAARCGYEDEADWALMLPRRPRASAFSRIALMHKAMCSSRGGPRS